MPHCSNCIFGETVEFLFENYTLLFGHCLGILTKYLVYKKIRLYQWERKINKTQRSVRFKNTSETLQVL